MVFICFGSEEIGLVGSKYYTENPLVPLEKIKFLINLDILGTGDDGIQVVNGKVHKKDFETLVKLNKSKNLLKEVKIRGEACNSDHCFFSEKGVPSFFIYTLGGISHYHNVYDKPETLPLTEYEDLFILLKDFILNK
jgi:aminopeptidase YwaD